MDEESLVEMLHRWSHAWDEDRWLEILYLKNSEDGYGYYLGSDLRKWEACSRTASSG